MMIKKYKHLIVLALVVVMVSLSGCTSTKLADGFDKDTVQTSAEDVIHRMEAGDYESVYAQFGQELKDAIDVNGFKEAVDPQITEAGTFEQYKSETVIGQQDKDTKEDMAVALIVVKYSEKKITYTITYNTDKEIIGLYVK